MNESRYNIKLKLHGSNIKVMLGVGCGGGFDSNSPTSFNHTTKTIG